MWRGMEAVTGWDGNAQVPHDVIRAHRLQSPTLDNTVWTSKNRKSLSPFWWRPSFLSAKAEIVRWVDRSWFPKSHLKSLHPGRRPWGWKFHASPHTAQKSYSQRWGACSAESPKGAGSDCVKMFPEVSIFFHERAANGLGGEVVSNISCGVSGLSHWDCR